MWTEEDDQLLAGIVLQAKKEGKIQLEAFDEASKVLNCSAAACGFRWNAVLRKKYIK